MRARCIDAVGVTFSKQKPRSGRTQINYSHSLEAGEGSRPSGRGEVGSDVTSPPERKRRARHPSLDCSVETCGIGGAKRDTTLVGWGRNVLDREVGRSRRGRAFQRFLSGIKRCRYSEKNVYFLTLTSSPECGYEFLRRDWIVLLKICREFFGQFGYCMIKTREGNGVVHMLFHSECCDSFRLDALHAFFSANWVEIHRAKVVWIRKTYGDTRLAGHLTQYLASQESGTRMSWSWGWVHSGFVADWERVKYLHGDIKKAIKIWDWYLQNDSIWLKCRLDKLDKVTL